MNHIYKIIWNKARACWQVVAETAKSSGKTKSSRRQNRRDNSLTLPALREYTKLATALAVVLGCSLGGVVYAAEGETFSDSGSLFYPMSEISGPSAFADFQAGKLSAGANYNTLVLATSWGGPTLVYKNGAEVFAGTDQGYEYQMQALIEHANSTAAGNYDRIVAEITVPGTGEKKVYTIYKSGDTAAMAPSSLIMDVNSVYWEKRTIAQAIAAAVASGDQAALQQLIGDGLPHYYLANGDSASDRVALGVADPLADWSSWPPKVYNSFYFTQQTAIEPTAPSSPGYVSSYEAPISIGAGQIWRPMDRMEETASAGGWDYSINTGWAIDSDGNIRETDATVMWADKTVAVQNEAESQVVSGATTITVKDLTVGKNGTIDLSYLNTHYDVSGKFNPADPIVSHDNIDNYGGSFGGYGGTYPTEFNGTQYQRSINRYLLVNNANLADGTTFRLGVYGLNKSKAANENTNVDTAFKSDSVFITNATAPDGHSNLYIELGWVPGVGTTSQGAASGGDVVLGILNGADQFTVTGRTSLADGIFSQYEITPVIGKQDNYFTDPTNNSLKTGTAWTLDSYSYIDLDSASESGRSAADNKVVLNNLWKSNYLNMFRRVGSLHRQGFTERHVELKVDSSPATAGQENADSSRTLGIAEFPVAVPDQKENVWAEIWHGQYKSSAAYGRQVGQTYNGMQVGYDKLLNKDLYNGKVYTGFYLSKVEGDSHTATGGGDQDSEGLGLYGAWLGDKGHYLDVALMASRLSNDYHLTGNTGSGLGRVTGDFNTWAYGLGLQYGYQTPLHNGWFWEPSAALFAGRVNGAGYTLSNILGVSQSDYDTVTGRLGLTAGKQLADGRGNVYAGIAVLHEFTETSSIDSFYNGQQRLLEPGGGSDTWWEFSLGGNMRISPTGAFNLDVSKTTGSDSGRDWKINGGLNWTWGGFWGGSNAADKVKALDITVPEPTGSAIVVGRQSAAVTGPAANSAVAATGAGDSLPAAQQPPLKTAAVIDSEDTSVAAPLPADSQAVAQQAAVPPAAGADAVVPYSGTAGEFAFGPVTVEAARPDWEKRLSPGQVSVIYPEQFEGEQKDLPDLLDRVPGLFVQRVSGDGHYTVARVRGSTGAQVNVYVDGVLMNLNGDAAVNLSTIPVDNVERIEVYRGYVPARFSGSPLGGVINIVTKKPKEVGGTVTQGVKSYGGYTGSYQLTAPAGNGSLLATYQRDIWDGDFPFTMKPDNIVTDQDMFGDTHRRSNGYRNEDGMVKWQDDHWTVKAAWKQLHEELPRPVNRLDPLFNTGIYDDYIKGFFDAAQTIKQKEFQIGRRDTVGSLDWGWKLYYLDSQKDYRNVGLYRKGYTEADFASYPGQLWSAFHSKKWGGNLNTARQMGSNHLVEMNFDYSRENMDANGSNWNSFDDSMTHFDRQFIREYKIQEYHLTLQDTVTLNQAGDFKLTPVLRADRVVMDTMADSDKKWQYSGAAALQKQLNSHWGIKTSWGTYNRHPNFYELFGDGATLKPNKEAARFFDLAGDGTWETGHQFDFSINWQGELAKADTDTALTWFQRRSKNQFALWQPAVPNAPATYFPMDDARVHGLELTHNMKWDRLNLSLAGTWQESEYTGNNMGGNYNGMKSHISYTPEWVWNARLDYLLPGDKLNIFTEYTYTDKQFLGAPENTRRYMQAFATVDVGLKYAFDRSWKLSAGVNDLFDKGYEIRSSENSTLSYPLAGRMYYATMEYKF